MNENSEWSVTSAEMDGGSIGPSQNATIFNLGIISNFTHSTFGPGEVSEYLFLIGEGGNIKMVKVQFSLENNYQLKIAGYAAKFKLSSSWNGTEQHAIELWDSIDAVSVDVATSDSATDYGIKNVTVTVVI